MQHLVSLSVLPVSDKWVAVFHFFARHTCPTKIVLNANELQLHLELYHIFSKSQAILLIGKLIPRYLSQRTAYNCPPHYPHEAGIYRSPPQMLLCPHHRKQRLCGAAPW